MYLTVHVIPEPKQIQRTDSKDKLYLARRLSNKVFVHSPVFQSSADLFVSYVKSRFGVELITEDTPEAVTFMTSDKLKPGQYRIQSDDYSLKVFAKDEEGAFYAVSTLIQLLQAREQKLYVPILTIQDEPDTPYRFFMLDLARTWHDVSYILNYVDLCFLYKVKYLHLHFTDDQSYTLPSQLFPKLSSKKHYSEKDIDFINRYAKSRGVELVPEIDCPGHCAIHQKKYPEIFGNNGVMVQNKVCIDSMKALFAEMCDMFPDSKYIHIGGDEAEIGKWAEAKESFPYYESIGLHPETDEPRYLSERLLANFVNEMANTVFEKGRQPIAWEGFSKVVNDYVRKDLWMISWENYYQVAPDLYDAGFKIINGSWKPLYIVTGHVHWTQEEVFNWDVHTWEPIHWGSPYYGSSYRMDSSLPVLGGGLLAWGDRIEKKYKGHRKDGIDEEYLLVCNELPAMAENTWNLQKRKDYASFCSDYAYTDEIRKILASH